jgi:hypothetical protein
VTAAFGDNLADSARQAAASLGLSSDQLAQLQSLGECLNYNGYGESLDDLFFHPAELYRSLQPYADPFAFIYESAAYPVLQSGYAEDMARAAGVAPAEVREAGRIFMLPAEKWARRISGVYGNQLAVESPSQAHAVLTAKPDGGYVVSVRAPLAAPGDAPARAIDPRRSGVVFDDVSAQLVACALALLNWHDSAGFSPSDGSPTRPVRAGWARRNLLTGHEEFPRGDPALLPIWANAGVAGLDLRPALTCLVGVFLLVWATKDGFLDNESPEPDEPAREDDGP